MMRYHQAHSAWSSRMRNASAPWTNEAVGPQPGRDAGKERHGTGLGTQQEAQGRVFVGTPLPRFIRCCKNVPMTLYCNREVLAEQQLQLRFPRASCARTDAACAAQAGIFIRLVSGRAIFYIFGCNRHCQRFDSVRGVAPGRRPARCGERSPSLHLVDQLQQRPGARGQDPARAAARGRRRPGQAAAAVRRCSAPGRRHLEAEKAAGLPLGARPRAGDLPHLVGQPLQRTAPASRGDQVRTRAESSSSCSASKPHLVPCSKAKLHHLNI